MRNLNSLIMGLAIVVSGMAAAAAPKAKVVIVALHVEIETYRGQKKSVALLAHPGQAGQIVVDTQPRMLVGNRRRGELSHLPMNKSEVTRIVVTPTIL